jgi:NAD-dependent SIR2 family protein deacetylase
MINTSKSWHEIMGKCKDCSAVIYDMHRVTNDDKNIYRCPKCGAGQLKAELVPYNENTDYHEED